MPAIAQGSVPTSPQPSVHLDNWGAAVEWALVSGVCGLGGVLSRDPRSWDDALLLLAGEHGPRVARRVQRFAAVPDGAFVWTRTADDLLLLGRVHGQWRYDGTPLARSLDLVHVRPCRWRADPVAPEAAPPAVRRTFARGGRNVQQVHDARVGEQSARLWEAAASG